MNLLTGDLFILSKTQKEQERKSLKRNLRLYSIVTVISDLSAIVIRGARKFRYDFAVFDVDNEL
jgi:hypothetical protein